MLTMALLLATTGGVGERIGRPIPATVYNAPAPRAPALLEQAMIEEHAAARAAHALPPLAWNPALAADARRWAEALAASGGFEHSANDDVNPQGENLWMGTRGAYQYREMVTHWVDEKADFLPGRPLEESGRAGWEDVAHYTQIVWKDTRELGCATASNGADDYLVCRYWPAGNVEGEAPLG